MGGSPGRKGNEREIIPCRTPAPSRRPLLAFAILCPRFASAGIAAESWQFPPVPLRFPSVPASRSMAPPAAHAHVLSPFDGATLSLAWGAPFAGLLLSIAFAPLLAPKLWHDHYGKCAAAWVLLLLVPFTVKFGTGEAVHNVAHAIVLEYVPFVA